MPDPYKIILEGTIQKFTFQGKEYIKNGEFSTNDACEMLRFVDALREANPRTGIIEETKDAVNKLKGLCPTHTNQVEPQSAQVIPPVEANPATAGGDSALLHAAPTPPLSGTVGITSPDAGITGESSTPIPTEESTRPPAGDTHPTHGGDQPQQQTTVGDPVDIFSGSFYLQETDLEIPNTILPLAFTRFYRSGAASFGPFGWNWDHNLNLFLRELTTGDVALWRNLHEEIFKFNGADFEPQNGVFAKLERVVALAQVYEITGDGGVVMHFERPGGWVDGERIPLLWIKDRHGNQLQFTYGAEDKLAEVRDDDNRFFSFEYDLCGLLVSVSDHAGRKFLYDHDEETMQLTGVKSPGISDHPDGIIRFYHYEQPWALPELRHNIVRVEDARGNIYLENTYDQDPASLSFARLTEQASVVFYISFDIHNCSLYLLTRSL